VSAEEQRMALLLADLQRYGALPTEDVRREVTTLTQTLASSGPTQIGFVWRSLYA
jgi:hypothetical protein